MDMDYQEAPVQNKGPEGKTSKRWSGIIKTAKRTIVGIVITAVIVCGLLATIRITSLESSLQETLTEQDVIEITSVRIVDRLVQIGELSTAAYEYENMRTVSDVRKIFGWDIPGTASTVNISYCGVVKVGYDVAKIQTDYNADKQIIFISLPEPEVIDNYIKLDGLNCTCENSILNPIELSDLAAYLEGFEGEALSGAVDSRIFEEAEARMRLLVENFLAVFPDCDVVFC